MIAVIQRVSRARVTVNNRVVGEIGPGLLVLLGVAQGDVEIDAEYLARRTAELRIFPDAEDKMNRSVHQIEGSVLVISQFTLLADTRKGRRPSFIDAAPPEIADQLYQKFCAELEKRGLTVAQGIFAAMMDVELVNQGPVTIILRSKEH